MDLNTLFFNLVRMSNECKGDGTCLNQCCGCMCFEDEECEIQSEICTCPHSTCVILDGGPTECDKYCNSNIPCPHNCKLVKCELYDICGISEQQWMLNAHEGHCIQCHISYGRIRKTDKTEDCPVCMDSKLMYSLRCKHKICWDCWKKMCDTTDVKNFKVTSCPLCRKKKW